MTQPVIALVIEGTYPWYRGGVSEWVAQYIQAFADHDFHIVQVATDPYLQSELSSALYEVPDQVTEFKRLSPPELDTGWKYEANRWYKKHLKNIDDTFASADIIHIANTGFAGWLGQRTAHRMNKPLILTEHALYWKEVEMGAVALECGYKVPQKQSEKQQMAQMFKQTAETIYNCCDEIVSVSQCNIKEQKEMGAINVHYIPNGVSEDWLVDCRDNTNQDKPVIGWIGRCAEMKNPLKFFNVVDAFKNHTNGNARFIMMICDAGETELQQQVIQKAKEYAEVDLIINQPAELFITEMDMLCITSYNESQPLVLFEALAKKVLPIGWEAGDVTNEFGLVVQDDCTPAMLAQKVMDCWNQPEKWRQMVEQRFNKIKEEHTWTSIFKQYRTLFKPYIKKSISHG